jgi:hypothetical protein
MSSRLLLFVDDLDTQHVLFKDAVDDWNEAHPEERFEVEFRDSYEAAKIALERIRIDGAVFDLRLPAPGKGKLERPLGNDLAKLGIHRNGIPVVILSARPEECDPDLLTSEQVKVFNKGSGASFGDAVKWFGEKWTMLAALSDARTRIRVNSADLFSATIWPRWRDYLPLATGDGKTLSTALTRQFVWHLGEVMGLAGEGDETWHPFENWICPPLDAAKARTGDIFDFEGELWLLMTPPCDLANEGRCENALLVKCSRDIPSDWAEVLEKGRNGTDKQKESARNQLRKLVNQATPSQHFLPPLPDDPRPVMVLFGTVLTIPLAELSKKLGLRLGSISAPFVNNLIQRFGSYISRVGQPNLDVEQLIAG